MKLKDIIIDGEFRDRLPPLTADEFMTLRDNIVSDGGVLSPIAVWREKSICVDGHNRKEIVEGLQAGGTPIPDPPVILISFADRGEAMQWIDAHARGQRSLTEKWRQIIIGRQYNATKKEVGQPQKVLGQADPINSDRSSEAIAHKEGVAEKSVRRYAAKAKVYDAVEEQFGRDSEEARAVLKAPQRDIDKIVSSKKPVDPARAVELISKAAKERKKAAKKAGTNNGNGKLYVDTKTSIQVYIDKAKAVGRAPADDFWKAIGKVTLRRWFKNLVSELHYMHIEEYEDGTVELVIAEKERNLCTAIHKQLERMRDISSKWNNFKFDPALYKKTVQELFDLISKASTHK